MPERISISDYGFSASWGGQFCLPTSFPAGRAAWKGGCGQDWPPHIDRINENA